MFEFINFVLLILFEPIFWCPRDNKLLAPWRLSSESWLQRDNWRIQFNVKICKQSHWIWLEYSCRVRCHVQSLDSNEGIKRREFRFSPIDIDLDSDSWSTISKRFGVIYHKKPQSFFAFCDSKDLSLAFQSPRPHKYCTWTVYKLHSLIECVNHCQEIKAKLAIIS